ncbi:MAG TPA: 2-amino-4-hydroxy-6-hydroxymethyldihydropteridine diphosphokinase [Dehalococcoidia bacterium]|nr:2-amino-4-hydroxy-6-hydroxymethyldihydropteridine diphosphokinase [Dehalococcoidia bacterium]
MAGIYLVLGSNLGNRQANMAMALRMLAPLARVEAVSALYESPPQPPAPPPPYLNAACRIVTGLRPDALLRHVKQIEREIGRYGGERWAPRPIDIDIALYDDQVIDLPELSVPHPRLEERAFFLRPLLDLDADLTHPATGEKLVDVLRRVGEDGLVRIAEVGWESIP